MTESASSFDPVWEDRYRNNPHYRNRYPWSQVVSFVFRSFPTSAARSRSRLLEVGCGNGANLWFAAREGLTVAGVDGSQTAIDDARQWFDRDKLTGDLRVADFAALPFDDQSFDIVIDRAALSHVCLPVMRRALDEIWRVLRPGGRFLFSPYSDRCSSCQGPPDADGCHQTACGGPLAPGQRVTFLGQRGVRELLTTRWQIDRMVHVEEAEYKAGTSMVYADWRVEVTKL